MAHSDDGSDRFGVNGIQPYMFKLKSKPEQDTSSAEAVEEPQRISPNFIIITVLVATPTGPPCLWTAVFDHKATADDKLSLCRGDLVEVLSKYSLVSRNEG